MNRTCSSSGLVSFQGNTFLLTGSLPSSSNVLPMCPVFLLPMYPVCTHPSPLPSEGEGVLSANTVMIACTTRAGLIECG